MVTTIQEYWSGGGVMQKEKRYFALLEIYPVKDLKIQLQELKKILEEVLLLKADLLIKEEEEALRIIKSEVEKLLSGAEVLQKDFDYILKLIFEGGNMPLYKFLGLV